MIIAQKETERYSNMLNSDEYVHITILKIKVEDIDEKKLMEFYDMELIDNDSEENYFEYGISTGWESELFCIEIEKFITGLKTWIELEKENNEDETSYNFDIANELVKSLEKYIEYSFYFEDDLKADKEALK